MQEIFARHLTLLLTDMSNLLQNPHLPKNDVKYVLISDGYNETVKSLESIGIECIKVACRTNVHKGILNHPDVNFCQIDHNTVVISNHQTELIKKLKALNRGINILEEKEVADGYYNEALLNSVFFGENVIYNKKTVSSYINDYIDKSNLNKIEVSQGYTKCSVAVVFDNAIITDDYIISKNSIEQGIDALLVEKGSVKLKGYNYGFIGGCCGKIGKNKIAFNGELKYHKDFEKIKTFLYKYDTEYVSLKKGELEDIGSIIPLTE